MMKRLALIGWMLLVGGLYYADRMEMEERKKEGLGIDEFEGFDS